MQASGGEFHGVVLPNIVSNPGSRNRVAPMKPGAMPHEAPGQHKALPHAQNGAVSASIARSLPTLKPSGQRPSPAGPAFRQPVAFARPPGSRDPFADTGLASGGGQPSRVSDDPFAGAGLNGNQPSS